MKEHFTMYSIVVIVSGKCVHVDAKAMCITFAMLPGIGMKENVVTNLRGEAAENCPFGADQTVSVIWIAEKGYVCYKQCGISFQNQ